MTNHIKNFVEHLNYITNHLDRLELNQKQSSPINETLPNRPNTSFGKSTHLEETSSDSPPLQQSSTPLNGANRRMFPMPENISFNSNSSSKNTKNKLPIKYEKDHLEMRVALMLLYRHHKIVQYKNIVKYI